MDNVWSKYLQTCNPWEPHYYGIFNMRNNLVRFFFKNRTCMLSIAENEHDIKVVHLSTTGVPLALPREWAIIEDKITSFLMISESQGIDLTANIPVNQIPIHIQLAYREQMRYACHYEEAQFVFGEYRICHKGKCGYVCMKNGELLWEFTGKGYLYTEVVCWKNRVMFGTAGRGGYFYILDIDTGFPIVSLKTGGTRCFIHLDNLCYVLSNTRHACLLCVDLSNDTIIDQCELPGKATVNSKLVYLGENLHAITFDYRNSELKGAFWNKINI